MKKENLPTWDLGALYNSITDPKINLQVQKSALEAKSFKKKYRGKISYYGKSADSIAFALKQYEEILRNASKPCNYASLIFAESSKDPERGAFLQLMQSHYKNIENDLLFFEIELLALPSGTIKKLAKEKALAPYKHYLSVLLRTKPHRLSEAEEKILNEKALTGREAFSRLFDEELSIKTFRVREKGKTKEVNESEALSLLYSPIRSVRREGARALSQGLKEESRRLTYIFNTLVLDKAVDDSLRNYKSPEDSRHLANETDRAMVDVMVESVRESYPLVRRFYNFKRRLLGLKNLFDYDRYAPVNDSVHGISFSDAKKVVIEAFSSFDREYATIAQRFFDEKWVDAAARPGKRGGAFCSFLTPDLNPYVFMNFTGNVRDIFTLAHELGHGIHAYLMRKQNFLNFDVPLTVAETASVFAEMVLFDFLKSRIKSSRELLSMYVHSLENVFATVQRQTALFLFERDLHYSRDKKGELSVEEISVIWRKRQEEIYGSSVTLTRDYDYWWSYIPHFIHTPFYVYAYTFGELLTISLYALYLKEREGFVRKYLDLLSAGGSMTPTELLKPFKIDLHKKEFWKGGLSVVETMVKEAERISRKL